jgi:hypothetical protein
VSLSFVPFLSVRDRIQLFALSATALLISFLGLLALAEIVVVLPLGFDAALKALPHLFTLAVETSGGQDLFVFFWAAISGVLFVIGVGRHAWMIRARLRAVRGSSLAVVSRDTRSAGSSADDVAAVSFRVTHAVASRACSKTQRTSGHGSTMTPCRG